MFNLGDWLSPIIVGVLTFVGARQANKVKLKRIDKEHSTKLKELEHRHEQDLYQKLSSNNNMLWKRIENLEKTSQDREEKLNRKIDGLYTQIGYMRDYANRLRGQLIEASMIPVPWPEGGRDGIENSSAT